MVYLCGSRNCGKNYMDVSFLHLQELSNELRSFIALLVENVAHNLRFDCLFELGGTWPNYDRWPFG